MAAASSAPTLVGDREIAATRVFAAPRELVWKVWTEPEHVVRWWGPNGFTTTTHSMDVKSGGVWRFVMHGPDGHDYQNKITYLEVVKPMLAKSITTSVQARALRRRRGGHVQTRRLRSRRRQVLRLQDGRDPAHPGRGAQGRVNPKKVTVAVDFASRRS
jgi:hypothetical protein